MRWGMGRVIRVAAVVVLVAGVAAVLWFGSGDQGGAARQEEVGGQTPGGRETRRVTARVAGKPSRAAGDEGLRSPAQLTESSTTRRLALEGGARPDDRGPDGRPGAEEIVAQAEDSGEQPAAPTGEGRTSDHSTIDCRDTWCWSEAAGLEIMRAEVTAGEFARCIAEGYCPAERRFQGSDCTLGKPERSGLPMNCLSYDAAEAYCKWHNARLPLLEEWYAEARARGKYPWGDDEPSPSRVAEGPGLGKMPDKDTGLPDPPCAHPEGRSESGLCDMVGNLAEWTGDPAPGAAPPTSVIVVVGFAYDSWLHDVGHGRGMEDHNVGFRCARERAGLWRDGGR